MDFASKNSEIPKDKMHTSYKYQQFIRLFVHTKNGYKFIVCVDRSSEGQELEYQIAEAYEQLLNKLVTFDQHEEIQLRTYKTIYIKHRGYQLVIPKNMTVGHFLEDQSEIECSVVLNQHTNAVKLEVDKKHVDQQKLKTNLSKQIKSKQGKSNQKEVQQSQQSLLIEEEQVHEQVEDNRKLKEQLDVQDEIQNSDVEHDLHELKKHADINLDSAKKQNVSMHKSNDLNSSIQSLLNKSIQQVQEVQEDEDDNKVIEFLVNNELTNPQNQNTLQRNETQKNHNNQVFKKNFKKSYPISNKLVDNGKPLNDPRKKQQKIQAIKPSLFNPGEELTISSDDEIQAAKPKKQLIKKDIKKQTNHSKNERNLFDDFI